MIARLTLLSSALAVAMAAAVPPAAHALLDSQQRTEEAGAILFRDKGCAHCHGEGGVGGQKAPSLVGIRNDKVWTPAKMTDQIMNGGQKMPPFSDSLTDAEIAQLVAYLRARHRPVPPQGPPVSPAAQ